MPRIKHEGEAEVHVLHLRRGVLAIPLVERRRCRPWRWRQERQFAGSDDREAARLIAGVHIREVGDAVARHVVVVHGLAQLLGRKQR